MNPVAIEGLILKGALHSINAASRPRRTTCGKRFICFLFAIFKELKIRFYFLNLQVEQANDMYDVQRMLALFLR